MGWSSIPHDRWQGSPFKAVGIRCLGPLEGFFFFLCPYTVESDQLNVTTVAAMNFRAEIRVQFRHVPGNLYNRKFGTNLDQAGNELVIRIQPDEAIYLKVNNKVPGLGMRLDSSYLNLLYKARY